MRKVFVVLAAILISVWMVSASTIPPCPSNVGYDVYVGLGSSGCVLDDKLFSNFTYSGSGSGGAVPLPASGVTVTAFNTPLFPGFQFQAPWSVGPGQTLDSLLQYDVKVLSGGHAITDIHASMGGFGHVPDGIVFVAENISGTFTGNLLLYDTVAGTVSSQTILVDPSTMGPIHVIKDISVNGNNGFASVSQVINRFSEGGVPEPLTLLLMGSGLLGLGALRWRKKS